MMGGFFIRFVRYLSAEEFAKLLQLARARTFKVVKNDSDSVVMWLLIGRHWVAGVSIGYRTESETEYISASAHLRQLRRTTRICIDHEEKQLEPKHVFDYKLCHHIDMRVTQEDSDGYRYSIRYVCHEVERKAVFAVEINTTQPYEHDEFILQLVAEELASESPRTVLRPM